MFGRSLIVYTNEKTGRIYSTTIFPIPFPVPQRNEFILNYSTTKMIGKVLYTNHFKATPEIDLQDYEDFDIGVIKSICDMQNCQEYFTAWNRPMLKLLYTQGFNGFCLQ